MLVLFVYSCKFSKNIGKTACRLAFFVDIAEMQPLGNVPKIVSLQHEQERLKPETMHKSEKVFSFELSQRAGAILLEAQEWPWPVLQVVTTSEADFETTLAKCHARGGFVATHDTDRTFCVIHLCSGDQDGKYPERHITTDSQASAERYLDSLKDAMVQAATWYYANAIVPRNN